MKFKELSPTFTDTVKRQLNLLKFIGIDVLNERNHNVIKRHVRIMIVGSFLITMFIGQILYILKSKKIGASFLDVINAIPTIFIVFQVCLKMIILIIKKNQLRDIIFDIGKEWPENMNEEKSRVVQQWTRRLKLFDNVFFRAAVVSILCFSISPLLITIYKLNTETDVKYEFIVQVYFFCDIDSTLKYAIFYVQQFIICVISHLCIYVGCDFVLVDLIFDLSILLSLVQIDLRNLNSHPPGVRRDNCNDIKELARRHQKLLRLTERLNGIFELVIFSQLSFSSIVICCYGFMAIIANGMFLKNVTASFGIMFAIFVLAWPGQQLIDTSSGVAEAAYQCTWYERSNKFRKYISIIIVRSQKPCKLTALGFSDLTLAMFSKVISTSWSYLSLLNQMYNDFDL